MRRNVYTKPYPTIGKILDEVGYDYDYISYRIMMKDGKRSIFAGCFKTEDKKIIPLDGDNYELDEEVLQSEEWSKPEEGINKGLTVVVDGVWV